MSHQEEEDLFDGAKLISCYTRAQAIEDGVLVDVSETAQQFGFQYPVAVTADVWHDIKNCYPGQDGYQPTEMRLRNLLYGGRKAIKNSREDGTQVLYTVVMPVDREPCYTVKIVCSGGDQAEPVLTIMRPDES